MRVNVDSKVVLDPEWRLLARELDMKMAQVLGHALLIWFACYSRKSPVLTEAEADVITEHDGFTAAMIRHGLAYTVGKGVSFRGVSGRIGYLLDAKEKGRRGGVRSGESRRKSRSQSAQLAKQNPPNGEAESKLEAVFGEAESKLDVQNSNISMHIEANPSSDSKHLLHKIEPSGSGSGSFSCSGSGSGNPSPRPVPTGAPLDGGALAAIAHGWLRKAEATQSPPAPPSEQRPSREPGEDDGP